VSDFSDKISDYAFHVPDTLIAQTPSPQREDAKLLVVRRNPSRGLPQFEDLRVKDLPKLCAEEPLLQNSQWIRNISRVFPARFYARRPSGSRHEIVLLEAIDQFQWKAIIRGSSSFRYPQILNSDTSQNSLSLECLAPDILKFSISKNELLQWLELHGEMPLPPYIKERSKIRDFDRYQSVWADENQKASAAAPTASLHFTKTLEEQLQQMNLSFHDVILDVGLGTFEPVRCAHLSEHKLHEERIFIPSKTLENLKQYTSQNMVAIGTTALRSIESYFLWEKAENQKVESTELRNSFLTPMGFETRSRLFIRPPFSDFHAKALWTNFHLPESTLFVLVCCFAGSRTLALEAYRHAIKREYRFFSYGDASIWI